MEALMRRSSFSLSVSLLLLLVQLYVLWCVMQSVAVFSPSAPSLLCGHAPQNGAAADKKSLQLAVQREWQPSPELLQEIQDIRLRIETARQQNKHSYMQLVAATEELEQLRADIEAHGASRT